MTTRISFKILKYLDVHRNIPIAEDDLIRTFGQSAHDSVNYLRSCGFIKNGLVKKEDKYFKLYYLRLTPAGRIYYREHSQNSINFWLLLSSVLISIIGLIVSLTN